MGNKQVKQQRHKVSTPAEPIQTPAILPRKKLAREERAAHANLLVFGFIRNCEQHIPTPICNICCLYYLPFLEFELDPKMIVNDWTFLKVVGRGQFGKAMQVRKNDTLQEYIMKVVKKKSLTKRKHIACELAYRSVISNIDHPFIVSIRFAFQSEAKYYMVYDIYIGSQLFYGAAMDTTVSCNKIRFYGAEICIALGYLHSIGIIYGDLTPDNIFLDNNGHIKITDFDYCKDSFDAYKSDNDTIVHIFNNDKDYSAPEIFINKENIFNKCIDWWSFGMIIYKMMTGLEPHYEEIDNIIENISNGNTKCCNDEGRYLLLNLLQKDMNKRLGYSRRDNLEIQEHAFFNTLDFDKLYK
eukprot:508255_1